MKQTIIIKGDNLEVVQVTGNAAEDILDARPVETSEDEWFDTGVSRYPVMAEGLLVHRFKPLEDFIAKLMEGDSYEKRVAMEMPEFLLMCHEDVEYDDETKYQIYRNQQACFMLGPGIFTAHRYGNFFVNTKTGERVKRHKGINPYDDWERVRDEQMQRLNKIWVASGGNFSMVKMEPWYTEHSGGSIKENYQKFIIKMTERFKENALERATLLRKLAGKQNPINGQI